MAVREQRLFCRWINAAKGLRSRAQSQAHSYLANSIGQTMQSEFPISQLRGALNSLRGYASCNGLSVTDLPSHDDITHMISLIMHSLQKKQ